jgi:hypothetical protein
MLTDPRSDEGAGRTVIERPPAGLARGRYPAPAWVVSTLGAAIVVAALYYLVWRLRRRAR